MAVVPGVLLDHVAEDPSNAGRLNVGRRAPDDTAEPIGPEHFFERGPGAHYVLLPQCPQILRSVARGAPRPIGAPAPFVPRLGDVAPEELVREPVVLAPSLVLEQPAEGHGRGPDRCCQTGGVHPGALPGERRPLPFQEPDESGLLICS